MLFRCLPEALYPGFAADGTLTALYHFYQECSFRQKLIFRVFKKPMFDRCEREHCANTAGLPEAMLRAHETVQK